MSVTFPTVSKIQPATDIAGIIMPFSQPSHAFSLFSGGAPEVRLGEEDMAVYVKRLSIRTNSLAGQSNSNQMPGVSITPSLEVTPTYYLANKVTFTDHDVNRSGMWGFSLQEAYINGMNQGHFQLMRVAALYGMNASRGEGLLNANGAQTDTLPADPFNNTTFSTYDNSAMFQLLLQEILALMQATYQFGTEQRCMILGPQREIGKWQTSVVQLAASQRDGGGTDTIVTAVKRVMKESGVTVEFGYDDTLIGKGAGGKDAIILTLPDIQVPKIISKINTNEFAKTSPSLTGCNVMYQSFAQPVEKTLKISTLVTEMLTEQRITSGWGLRPEAIMILSGTY